jgi:hypothetical protein
VTFPATRPGERASLATRLLDDLDDRGNALARAGHPDDRAEGPGRASATADDLPHVVLCDEQAQDDAAVVRLGLDADGVGLVDEASGQERQDVAQDV